MRECWIETNIIDFIEIQELRICCNINEHGTAYIKGCIKDEDEDKYKDLLLSDTWCKITAVNANNIREHIFCGIIIGYTIKIEKHQKVMEVELRSGTFWMDIEKHLRSFQNPDNAFHSIFQKVMQGYYKNKFFSNDQLNQSINKFILQYEETDWEFLKRVSSMFHGFLVPDTNNEGVRLYIGLPQGRTIQINDSNRLQPQKDFTDYWEKRRNGINDISEWDCIMYDFFDREIHRLGDKLIVAGIVYYICSIESVYTQGELIHHYYIKNTKALKQLEKYSDKIKGCSLLATIKEVKGCKVKINILHDELSNEDSAIWFPYATPYSSFDGTGWYCMPEVNDSVRVYFPVSDETQGYVVSSVHLTEDEERKDPNNKIWKTKYQKEICFTPDSIIITNNKGMKIAMIDGEGIRIESDKSIMINADKDISIISTESALMFSAEKVITLKQGEVQVQIDKDINFMGGEFRVQ